MFLIHSELYFAYILFGLTRCKKVCFLNFGFNLRYFLGIMKYLYGYFSKKILSEVWSHEDFTIE